MLNECLIYLCDCTCLNMLHMLNYMLIKHKKIFECFSCFWKVFLFWKISKKLCNFVLVTCLAGQANRLPQLRAYTEDFHDLLAGQCPSRKKDLEFFQKFGFLDFSRLYLATCLWVEAPVMRLYINFHSSLRDLFVGGPSSHEKHLDKFFKNFVSKVFGNLFPTWFSHEKRVFCAFKDSF